MDMVIVVVSESSEEIQEHIAACYLCCTADCVLIFHPDTDAPLHEVSTVPLVLLCH